MNESFDWKEKVKRRRIFEVHGLLSPYSPALTNVVWERAGIRKENERLTAVGISLTGVATHAITAYRFRKVQLYMETAIRMYSLREGMRRVNERWE